MYTIIEQQVVNSISPSPALVTEYNVMSNDGIIFMRTTSEDKAVARLHQMTVLADLREL